VIVTTTHSAGWSQLPRFALPPMTESEALELVRLRLARVLPPDGEDDPRLIELVDALERYVAAGAA